MSKAIMGTYLKAKGIYYRNEINAIHKSGVQIQPVYEAFSNAWESVNERFKSEHMNNGHININFHFTLGLFKADEEIRTPILDKIVVSDNGLGLNP